MSREVGVPQPLDDSLLTSTVRFNITRLARYKVWLILAFLLLLVVLLSETVSKLANELHYHQVAESIRATPWHTLLLAVLATLVSYVALTGYDRSALHYVGVQLPYQVVGPTAFIAYALSNTVGLGILTGGAVRFRLYTAAGVEPGAISRVIAFNTLAFGMGLSVVGSLAILWEAKSVAATVHLPVAFLYTVAVVMLLAMITFLWRCHCVGEIGLPFGYRLRLPNIRLVWQQLAISALDIVASATVLWLLLPEGAVPFATFMGFYAIAIALGILSHVPGGLGVFEAIILLALGGQVSTDQLAGALVLYRLVYYLLPLALAVLMLGGYEISRSVPLAVKQAAQGLSPLLLAVFTFIVAIILLVSGVTPASHDATVFLRRYVPLPLVEASHFLSSIAGFLLLFVARGMLLRLKAAWWVGVCLLPVSVLFALPKGLALIEVAILLFLLVVLLMSRRFFTRESALLSQAFSPSWWFAFSLLLGAICGLLFFVYRDVDYTHDLWWRFEFNGDAPRSLRAMLAVVLLALAVSVYHFLRPRPAALAKPDSEQLIKAQEVIQQQTSVNACLALMGDKYLLFSQSEKAFVMFGRQGKSWISLYDPVGTSAEQEDLIWQFISLVRESGGRACFYQVRSETLPLYLDAGLRLYKLGEEAFVPLTDFSLQGSRRAGLRQTLSRAERDGLRFEIIFARDVPALIGRLRHISDVWLAMHNTSEKGFSLGAFEADYLCRQDLGLVWQGDQLIAFASLLSTARKLEASVDLMRQLADVPRGTMDFLFVKILLHFQSEGYQRFSLGMAPLSGMSENPLASRWHRMGRLLFLHGEYFYNFQGLRSFKEKFDPDWEPRYLAVHGSVSPLVFLKDIAILISGGLRKVVMKTR